jgi:hypothetical protein
MFCGESLVFSITQIATSCIAAGDGTKLRGLFSALPCLGFPTTRLEYSRNLLTIAISTLYVNFLASFQVARSQIASVKLQFGFASRERVGHARLFE